MDVPYEKSGRSRQKGRTRTALVDATRELLGEGVTPTVEQAADRAGISRTTAYRYFVNQRALLAATYPELEEPSLLPGDAPTDAGERLELVTAQVARQLIDHEPELRAALRLSLEDGKPARSSPIRQGRVIGWLEDALSPLRRRLGARGVRRLVLAIRATLGIEAFVWLVDIGGLSRRDATDLMRDSARTLFRAASAGSRD
ncbi:MAG TPA: TetR/AcrR family transcriptional regulator [Kofleriaceae bacterium]|nr:TetR/AcrR family transcriptional regulator [Kofleriaceae bacterium]